MPKESYPSRPLELGTCIRREKDVCSGATQSDLGDLVGGIENLALAHEECLRIVLILSPCYKRGHIIISVRGM